MGMDREASTSALEKGQAARRAIGSERALQPKATSLAVRLALLAGSVAFSLAALEVGCRLLRGGPEALADWPNLAREHMSNNVERGTTCAYAYDETLGWTSPPNCASPQYNIDGDGFRRTSAPVTVAGPPILATGSSFAKGDEVADDESWPAYLQTETGRRVVNAGVSGYALDQIVMFAERITPQVKPLAIVATFTPGDIRRTELKVAWSREKPYFSVSNDGLTLRNVPVPGQPGAPVPLPVAAGLLGWSVLADEVVKRLGIRKGWYYDEVQAMPPGSGETIACLLMPRLAAIGVPVMIVAQFGRGYWTSDPESKARNSRAVQKVLGCAAEAGLLPLDLSDPMKETIAARGVNALFGRDHHSAEGNRVVADLIKQELARRKLLP